MTLQPCQVQEYISGALITRRWRSSWWQSFLIKKVTFALSDHCLYWWQSSSTVPKGGFDHPGGRDHRQLVKDSYIFFEGAEQTIWHLRFRCLKATQTCEVAKMNSSPGVICSNRIWDPQHQDNSNVSFVHMYIYDAQVEIWLLLKPVKYQQWLLFHIFQQFSPSVTWVSRHWNDNIVRIQHVIRAPRVLITCWILIP